MSKTDDLLRARGLTFNIVTEPEVMEQIYSLRYKVFCEEMGVCSKAEFPDEKERDEYDGHSVHLALMREEKVVAYCRLITYHPSIDFPIKTEDPLIPPFNEKCAVQIGKACVPKEERGADIIWVCFNKTYEYCQMQNKPIMLCYVKKALYEGYKTRGVPFLYDGIEKIHHGHKSHSIIIDVRMNIEPNFY